jgi:hypothetical protein
LFQIVDLRFQLRYYAIPKAPTWTYAFFRPKKPYGVLSNTTYISVLSYLGVSRSSPEVSEALGCPREISKKAMRHVFYPSEIIRGLKNSFLVLVFER